MATFTPSNSAASAERPDPECVVMRVNPEDRRDALARLLGAGPEDRTSVDDYLARVDEEGIDLGHLWVARRTGPRGSGSISQACLALVGAGRTAVVLVSPGLPPMADGRGAHALARRERAMLLRRACQELPTEAVVLAQALLEPEEDDLIGAYEDAGFTLLARLGYLRRPIPMSGRGHSPDGLLGAHARLATLADWPPAKRDAIMREVLAKTYEQTLDCPALCGLRSVGDVLDSHKSVGKHDPHLWLIVMDSSASPPSAEGCLLLGTGTAPDTVELVYLGLSPRLRGKGIGDALLREGLARLRGRPETTLACAVDLGNGPALGLYRRAGFSRFAERVAMVRSLGRPES